MLIVLGPKMTSYHQEQKWQINNQIERKYQKIYSVKKDLHGTGDTLSVAENLMKVFCSQDRPQGCLSKQSEQIEEEEELCTC